jgi:hypothetical protein
MRRIRAETYKGEVEGELEQNDLGEDENGIEALTTNIRAPSDWWHGTAGGVVVAEPRLALFCQSERATQCPQLAASD